MKNIVGKKLSGDISPTEEQQKAIDLFKSGGNLAIEAGAGTGKTSTLKMIADATARSGQYLAFNKAIVVDSSAKFPSNVKCKTAHSLAYGSVVAGNASLKERLNAPRQRLDEVATILGVPPFFYTVNGTQKNLSPAKVASIIQSTVYNFSCSAAREVSRRHVPLVDGIDEVESYFNQNNLAKIVAPLAQKAWDDISQDRGRLQFKHEHYLKLFQLNDPIIRANFILFDEAQDANPVMLDIVSQQDAQVVFVGDSNQQIYEFTGAVNAMENIGSDNTTYLTQSFRFGPAVADAANHILDLLGSEIQLVGYDKIKSEIGRTSTPDCVLVRTNAGAVTTIIDELMHGKKVAYVGNVNEIISFVRACKDLQNGKGTMHPELMCFENWDDLCEYVEMVDDKSLKLMVDLIKRYTAQKIIDSFSQLVDEKYADITVTTAHKSKGREWPSIYLGTDFADEVETASPSEQRLMYVAVTRAQNLLDVTNINIFNKFYEGQNDETK